MKQSKFNHKPRTPAELHAERIALMTKPDILAARDYSKNPLSPDVYADFQRALGCTKERVEYLMLAGFDVMHYERCEQGLEGFDMDELNMPRLEIAVNAQKDWTESEKRYLFSRMQHFINAISNDPRTQMTKMLARMGMFDAGQHKPRRSKKTYAQPNSVIALLKDLESSAKQDHEEHNNPTSESNPHDNTPQI